MHVARIAHRIFRIFNILPLILTNCLWKSAQSSGNLYPLFCLRCLVCVLQQLLHTISHQDTRVLRRHVPVHSSTRSFQTPEVEWPLSFLDHPWRAPKVTAPSLEVVWCGWMGLGFGGGLGLKRRAQAALEFFSYVMSRRNHMHTIWNNVAFSACLSKN